MVYFYTASAVGWGVSREVQPLWLIGGFSAIRSIAARKINLMEVLLGLNQLLQFWHALILWPGTY